MSTIQYFTELKNKIEVNRVSVILVNIPFSAVFLRFRERENQCKLKTDLSAATTRQDVLIEIRIFFFSSRGEHFIRRNCVTRRDDQDSRLLIYCV